MACTPQGRRRLLCLGRLIGFLSVGVSFGCIFERLFFAEAFGPEVENGGMVDEPVDGGAGHGLVHEKAIPFAERLVGRDDEELALITIRDEVKERHSIGHLLLGVAEVLENEQVVAVELLDGGGQPCRGRRP